MTADSGPDIRAAPRRPAHALSAQAAAALLGVHERTVRRAIERGELTATKRGGTFRITPAALERYQRGRHAHESSTHSPPPTPVGMPVPPTPIIGREREVAAVRAMLLGTAGTEATRLVTLIGPGGVGKTRLAITIAEGVTAAFPDGVWFVPLAPVDDPGLVPAALAAALGVGDAGGRPLVAALRAYLRDRRVLLVLDNFEHVLGAAPVVASLLSACPGLAALVTSRALLRLSGEHAVVVPPLATPDPREPVGPDDPGQAPAVRLFVERARAAHAGFSLGSANAAAVVQICRRLDGLPLAIELAAAQTRYLPPTAVLDRLEQRLPLLTGGPRDAPERHQTMRRAIAWSYDLLDDSERALFRRLAVFVGGFTLGAAGAVAGGEGERGGGGGDDLVASLVDKSLLHPVAVDGGSGTLPPRFGMLDTVREFGLELLEARGEAGAARSAHAAWCLALAERAEPTWTGPEEGLWLDRLDAELDNLRAALAWAVTEGEAEFGLRLVVALSRFWGVRGHLRDARAWLERLLALPGGDRVRPALRATALNGLCNLALDLSDYETARACGEESLAIRRRLGDRAGIANCLDNLAALALGQGDAARERALLEEALALRQALGTPQTLAVSRARLGGAVNRTGDHDRARSLLEEALAGLEAQGDTRGVAYAWIDLGDVACGRGDAAEARRLIERSLAQLRDVGDKRGTAIALHRLAGLVAHEDAGQAAGLLAEALALYRDLGDRRGIGDGLEAVAAIAAARGRARPAARLLGTADAMLTAIGAAGPAGAETNRQRLVAAVRAALGVEPFSAAWAEGRALSLEDVVAEAIAEADRAGEAPMAATDAACAGHDVAPAGFVNLTPRELDVLRLLAEGLSNKEVAARLAIAPRTVANHVTAVLAKLGVPSRAAAAAFAVRHGLA